MTDIVMPGMNGQELAARIRELKPEIKCLYMSGFTDNILDHDDVREAGLDFIQKPFSIEAVARNLQSITDSR